MKEENPEEVSYLKSFPRYVKDGETYLKFLHPVKGIKKDFWIAESIRCGHIDYDGEEVGPEVDPHKWKSPHDDDYEPVTPKQYYDYRRRVINELLEGQPASIDNPAVSLPTPPPDRPNSWMDKAHKLLEALIKER